MYSLSWSSGFQKGFKKATRKNPALQKRIFSVLKELSEAPFNPGLKTHKLHGKLSGLWAYGFHDLRYFTLKIYQAFDN